MVDVSVAASAQADIEIELTRTGAPDDPGDPSAGMSSGCSTGASTGPLLLLALCALRRRRP
jgi:hypothetical protein